MHGTCAANGGWFLRDVPDVGPLLVCTKTAVTELVGIGLLRYLGTGKPEQDDGC